MQQNVQAKIKAKAATMQMSPGSGDAIAYPGEESSPSTQHYLLLCEHPPVYTLGKSGHIENILISETDREARGIEYYPTNRGEILLFMVPAR